MPTVSIIVPNYNHAPYLRQRLDSIFNQTFQDFEVIILDDCSTDNSKEIIEEYRSRPQVNHIIYNETNSGSPFKQWAKGFDLAQGKYIWIAESDDWAELNLLEELVHSIERQNNIVISFCQSIYSYEKSSKVADFLQSSCIMNGRNFFNKHMLFHNSICNASSVLFRKEVLNEFSDFYQSFQGAGDYLLWIEILQTGDIAYVHKPLNYFRQHNSNTTTSNRLSGNEFFECFYIFKYLRRKKITSLFKSLIIKRHFLNRISLAYKYNELNKSAYKSLYKLWGRNIIFESIIKLVVPIGICFWSLTQRKNCQ